MYGSHSVCGADSLVRTRASKGWLVTHPNGATAGDKEIVQQLQTQTSNVRSKPKHLTCCRQARKWSNDAIKAWWLRAHRKLQVPQRIVPKWPPKSSESAQDENGNIKQNQSFWLSAHG